MAQPLEWLLLLAEAAGHVRTEQLLDGCYAARAGAATEDGFKEFTRELRQKL